MRAPRDVCAVCRKRQYVYPPMHTLYVKADKTIRSTGLSICLKCLLEARKRAKL